MKMGDNARFEVHAPGAHANAVEAGQWHLPGLDVKVTTALASPVVNETADGLEIRYPVAADTPEVRLDLVLTHIGK